MADDVGLRLVFVDDTECLRRPNDDTALFVFVDDTEFLRMLNDDPGLEVALFELGSEGNDGV